MSAISSGILHFFKITRTHTGIYIYLQHKVPNSVSFLLIITLTITLYLVRVYFAMKKLATDILFHEIWE